MTIGRWYLRRGQTLAAIGRFRNVVDDYQTTSHTPEALYRLVEAYLTLGLLEEAKRNGAVLGANYPGDPWYRDAYRLLTDKGLQPAEPPRDPGERRNYLQRLLDRDGGGALPPPDAEGRPPAQAAQADDQPADEAEEKEPLWRRMLPGF